jgi:hypothetical protein
VTTYASKTDVSSDRSRNEIETTLRRYGADEFGYMSGRDRAQVAFSYKNLRVRFVLPMPDPQDREFTHHSRGVRTASARDAAYEQAVRQKWRALALVVKAKLEAVESGISTFEEEFFAHLVLPGGQTVFESVAGQVDSMIASGRPGSLMIEAAS